MSKTKRDLQSNRAPPSRRSTACGAAETAQPRFANSNRSQQAVVPLRERCWVSVDEASQVAGEGRTRLYELIRLGKLLTKRAGRRRLVNVASLLEYCAE
jgi:hypothetical protein